MRTEAQDDSEIEGFISCDMEIGPYHGKRHEREDSLSTIFEPHYILGTPMLRKQPPQCYLPFLDIPLSPLNIIPSQVAFKSSLRLSLLELETNSQKYRLVYSRFKKPFGISPRLSFSHEVTLKISTYKHCEYTRGLRPWKNDNMKQEDLGDSLLLESRFEGGNLLCAFRNLQQMNTYTLFMQNDTNSYGYNQWFYYSIRNAQPGVVYTFRIVNFRKKYSFFKKGMMPTIFSLKRHQLTGNGWYRAGKNINYYETVLQDNGQGQLFTLQFQIAFQHSDDYISISANPPYSYSRLIHFLTNYSSLLHSKAIELKMRSAGKTLAGNSIPFLTIQLPTKGINRKPSIVILARQHSGQIWSSFLMEELLNELAQAKQQSLWLLQRYTIHVIPMVNVDGVIYGNFRCDIGGYDLNRCWKEPSEVLHPQICRMKTMLEDICQQSTVQLCLDLHTHSKETGIFGYCCSQSKQAKMLPLLISSLNPLFRFRACTFGITRDKRTTARAAIFEMSNCSNIITIQMSTFGYVHKSTREGQHFTVDSLKEFASAVLEAVFTGGSNQIRTGGDLYDPRLLEMMGRDEQNSEEAVSGSDSEPEADEIAVEEKMKRVFPRAFMKELIRRSKSTSKRKSKPYYSIKKAATRLSSKTETSTDSLDIPSAIKAQTRYQQSLQSRKLDYSYTNSILLTHEKDKKRRQSTNSRLLSPTSSKPVVEERANNIKRAEENKMAEQEVEWKPLSTMEFSLKNLPIFAKETLPPSYQAIASQNHSLMLTTMGLPIRLRDPRRNQQREGVFKPHTVGFKDVIEEEGKNFPYLCVLSEKKRSQQLQRIRERRIQSKRSPNLKEGFPLSALEKYSLNNQEKNLGKLTNYPRVLVYQEESRRLSSNLTRFKMRLSKERTK